MRDKSGDSVESGDKVESGGSVEQKELYGSSSIMENTKSSPEWA